MTEAVNSRTENGLRLRIAVPSDAEVLLEIYAPYVENTVISFEYDVPTVPEFRQRIENTLKKYPYIVAEIDGETVGYAYTGAFKPRKAYGYCAETSVYVKKGFTKKGIGRALYGALESISKEQGILNLNACIGYPVKEDEHLTRNSAQFHSHMGYTLVGEFHKCGYKFGRWYDMIWMEKMLGEHTENPKPFIPFSALETEKTEKCLSAQTGK